jgi:hypothetical protein
MLESKGINVKIFDEEDFSFYLKVMKFELFFKKIESFVINNKTMTCNFNSFIIQ